MLHVLIMPATIQQYINNIRLVSYIYFSTLWADVCLSGLVGGGGLGIQSAVVTGLTQASGSILSHNATVISSRTRGAVGAQIQTSQIVEGSQGAGPLVVGRSTCP